MTKKEKINEVLKLYQHLGGDFLANKRYVVRVNFEQLSKIPWVIEYFESFKGKTASVLFKEQDSYNKDLGVYDELIYEHTIKYTAVHFAIREMLFYYLFWLLKDELELFIENAKVYQNSEARYDIKDNSLLFSPIYYDEIIKRIYKGSNVDALFSLIQWVPILKIPSGLYYKMRFDDIERFILKTGFYDYQTLDSTLNAYKK